MGIIPFYFCRVVSSFCCCEFFLLSIDGGDVSINPPVSLPEEVAFWVLQVMLRVTVTEETEGLPLLGAREGPS